MDECVPPIIRDSRWFMYPFFRFWFKNAELKSVMDFKSKAFQMTEAEFSDLYRRLQTRAKDRPTDLNEASLHWMMSRLDSTATSLLDVGCGRGKWLNEVAASRPQLQLTGLDFFDEVPLAKGQYVRGNVESLPFPDKSFDIVTCHHTIEHLQHLPKAIAELKRVARKQLVIATPCQRYYYYSLDLHLHFFPDKSSLLNLLDMPAHQCEKIDGDWAFIGKP